MKPQIKSLRQIYVSIRKVAPKEKAILKQFSNTIAELAEIQAANRTLKTPVINKYSSTGVMKAVCYVFKTEKSILIFRTRLKHIKQARQLLIYILHIEMGWTQVRTAKYVKRDHSTVNHTKRRMIKMLATDTGFADKVKTVYGILKEELK